MRTTMLASVLLLCVGMSAFATEDTRAAGECGGFEWDMTREVALLKGKPSAVVALATAMPDARPAPLEQRLDVALMATKQVKLEVPPRREASPDTHAGFVKIHVSRKATYRVSANQRLWIELVGPAGVVKSTNFTMSGTCETLRKSVVFPLEAETDYWIQLSGSPTAEAILLVTPDR